MFVTEGNRRSGVTLAMQHRLSCISTYGINGLEREMNTPIKLHSEYYGIFTYIKCRMHTAKAINTGTDLNCWNKRKEANGKNDKFRH